MSGGGCSTGVRIRHIIIGMLLGAVVVGATWAYLEARRPLEAIDLNILVRMIPVETVREIPGEATIIERIDWRTRPAEVDPVVIRELALELCPEPTGRQGGCRVGRKSYLFRANW